MRHFIIDFPNMEEGIWGEIAIKSSSGRKPCNLKDIDGNLTSTLAEKILMIMRNRVEAYKTDELAGILRKKSETIVKELEKLEKLGIVYLTGANNDDWAINEKDDKKENRSIQPQIRVEGNDIEDQLPTKKDDLY